MVENFKHDIFIILNYSLLGYLGRNDESHVWLTREKNWLEKSSKALQPKFK